MDCLSILNVRMKSTTIIQKKKIIFLLLNGFCVFKPDSGGKSARVRDHDAVYFRLDLCVLCFCRMFALN